MKALMGAVCLAIFCLESSFADELDRTAVKAFIDEMVERHAFARGDLDALFREVRLEPVVLAAIAKPAESKPWYQYRTNFVTPERTEAGIDFWVRNRAALERAERAFGVPPHIIAGIIGVETYYGKNTGSYVVVDALSTLAFHFPPRAAFFRSELESFLLFTRDHGMDAASIKGSYAGAMGIPQFIPSSYRRYAVDFDHDGRADIWENSADAIASVGNYLKAHGWEAGKPIAVPARVTGRRYDPYLYRGGEPSASLKTMREAGIAPEKLIGDHLLGFLVALETDVGREFWLALKNFFVITRYNHSALYAMAVFQLAEGVRHGYKDSDANPRAPIASH
ncbi:MAG: lytic murein transglycosylase B [Gammaproteobacteria bacterium]